MRWIAAAGMVWGVVLGAINGPLIGSLVLAAGVVLVAISSAAANRADRAAQAALLEAAPAAAAPAVEVPAFAAATAATYPETVTVDEQVAGLLVEVRSLEDIAAVAALPAASLPAHRIERLLAAVAAVAPTREPSPAARTDHSMWTVGRTPLEHVPDPVGLAA